ncbi:MAG: hypothetical protein AAGA92_06515 [Planctomycetota bacterium]
MAKWRVKAAEAFGFEPNKYSYAHSKKELFADLAVMALSAADEGDSESLKRISDFVCWACAQTADDLQSVVDLAFFLPLISEQELAGLVLNCFPADLVAGKRHLLLGEDE